MTTQVTIVVPDHVERVVLQTQSRNAEGAWKDDEPVAYGPGSHSLHIWDTKRIVGVAERTEAQDAEDKHVPQPFAVGDVVCIKGQEFNGDPIIMTIEGMFTHPSNAAMWIAACCWFDKKMQLQHGQFDVAMLTGE